MQQNKTKPKQASKQARKKKLTPVKIRDRRDETKHKYARRHKGPRCLSMNGVDLPDGEGRPASAAVAGKKTPRRENQQVTVQQPRDLGEEDCRRRREWFPKLSWR